VEDREKRIRRRRIVEDWGRGARLEEEKRWRREGWKRREDGGRMPKEKEGRGI
jgi:hypothetical protein